MRSRNLVILSAVVAVVAVAIFGTVGFGIYAGLNASQHRGSAPGAVVVGSVPNGLAANKSGSTTATAPGVEALPAADNTAGSAAIAEPAPGAFYPGMPPFGSGGPAADGISAWGVAYRQVSDAAAQPDAALIKAAYQDAEKKATDLAGATGVKLGKLAGMTDYSNNQPYFRPCIYSGGGPEVGTPPNPGIKAPQGTTGSASGSATTTIAPAPCKATSNNNYYLVVWVYVRHAIG